MARGLRSSKAGYGWLAIGLHWTTAPLVIGLFVLGWWMVNLDYYDPWYTRAPSLHQSIGLVGILILGLRFLQRVTSPKPASHPGHRAWERVLAHLVHWLLYALLLAVSVSGYLITTADGRPILFFEWLEIPATVTSLPNQEDVAGEIHEYLAYVVVALIALHVAGGVKHQFIDRDGTLYRMLGLEAKASTDPGEDGVK
jgi:cytochrome b561